MKKILCSIRYSFLFQNFGSQKLTHFGDLNTWAL